MTNDHERPRRRGRVAEPVQVYLERADRDRLDRLAGQLGATKSDVLRRGLAAWSASSATRRRTPRSGSSPSPSAKRHRGRSTTWRAHDRALGW
jgi:hypothetical protein